ncbi:MAG: hypothetical protein HN883_06705 [Euryarchaeota archaeon]|nr:hypothetical protein [Euryarchaeota archaeon]
MGSDRYGEMLPVMAMMLLMLLTPLHSVMTGTSGSTLPDEIEVSPSLHLDDQFNESDGFTPSNITIDSATGEAILDHPIINWQPITNTGLMFTRTGACAAHLPSSNEVLLMGGRADPNPMQSGDEAETNFVETFDLVNLSWGPSEESMPFTQMYFGCATVGDKVYTIGDYHPFNTPEIRSEGLVQIFNSSNDTWIEGTSMPSGKAVGLAGVDNVGNFIYVAGGVSRKDRSDTTDRLMRYNTNTDTWDEMANMSVSRHSFELVEYHGKLYALGGIETYFDPTINQNVSEPSNHTEVYDVLTDTWANHSVLPFEIAAYAATVHNDEIIISGGITGTGWNSFSKDVYGYNPLTGAMSEHSQLPVNMYDHTITGTNGTILYASGDSSSFRFSTWSNNYLDQSEYFENPDEHDGWLTSDILDLRKTVRGTCSPVWLELSGQTPLDTQLNLQYKIGVDSSLLETSNWLPVGPQNTSQYFHVGNHSLVLFGLENSFFQYRVQFNTTELNNWEIPSLDHVKIYSEEATLLSLPPVSLHPNAAPIELTSFHSAYGANSNYSFLLHSTNSDGFILLNSNAAKIVWDVDTDTFSIDDVDGILKQNEISVQKVSSTPDGDEINWTISVEEGLPSDYFAIEIITNGLHQTSYRSPAIISIENILDVHVIDYSSSYSSQGGFEVSTGEVFPDGAEIDVTIDHSFNSTATRLLYGTIEARLHVDVESPNFGWFNSTGEWFTLQTGLETETSYILPNASSGEARIWLEARTQDDFVLNVIPSSKEFILNVDAPLQTMVSPTSGSYINENPERNVEFEFYDIGGFSEDTVQGFVWVEALHDSNSDGQFSFAESVQYPLGFTNIGLYWVLNLTVNDTANFDHQMVHITLEGENLAGKNIRDALLTPDNGYISWMSRTPEKANLSLIEPLFETMENGLQRLEPTGDIGWKVVVSDSNNLSDISHVRIELGNDETLGMRYNKNLDTCEEMDARIRVAALCYAVIENNNLTIYFVGKVDWTFVNSALDVGHLEVQIDDYDGTNIFTLEEQWSLERQIAVDIELLRDSEGPVQGELVAGWSMISGEHVQLNATVNHLVSNSSYNGFVSVFWRGKIQNDFFSSSYSAEVIDGKLSTQIQTPMGSGLWHQTVLEIWDPYDSEKLFSTTLPSMYLDGEAPLLLPSTLTSGVSRYHLDSVEIGVNIAEANSWTENLTLNCQIQALDFDWPIITLSRESSTIYDGKTMFSFTYNFAEQGDPSTLSTQSNIACWGSGSDDAGWELTSTDGNSANDPWLISSLSNIGPDLAISSVEFEGDASPGSKLRLEMKILSSGERIEVPFNITISIVQGETSTIVGRESLPSITENTAVYIRSAITVPNGDWTLFIEVDPEQEIWELSEINNLWSVNYSAQSEGLSGTVIAISAGGGFLLVVGISVVLLRKRKDDILVEDEIPAKKPLKGPPLRKDEGKEVPANLKGPPPKSPEPAPETVISPVAEMVVATPATPVVGDSVTDYSQLPGGGEYQYEGSQTFYAGVSCGKWMQNPDQSFTRLE